MTEPIAIGTDIHTPRLHLRKPEMSDHDALLELWSDPDVTRNLPSGQPVPAERIAPALEGFMHHWDEHCFGVWSLVNRATGRWIGYCGLRYLPNTTEIELLYGIGKTWWRRGLTSEAARTAVEYGFDVAQLPRIVALALPANIGSIVVMKNAGLRYEKDDRFFGLDVVYYSLNREDYSL